MINISMEGLPQAQRKYKELPKNVEDGLVEVLEGAFRKAAQNARRRAPKRTGAMRKAIQHKVHRNQGNVRGVVYIDAESLQGVNGTGGKREFYPAYVEYGTKAAGRRKRKGEEKGIRRPGNKAKPFIRPGMRYLKRTVPPLVDKLLKSLEEE